jgi:hypothetical protein
LKYTIKAHPTKYKEVLFRSRLEARWACFFDLASWKWEYEPIDLPGWSPDFRVEFPCGHSECEGSHSLLVEVKPYFDLVDFAEHPCMDYPFGRKYSKGSRIPADASAAFGAHPRISFWEMAHGSGGGVESIARWVNQDLDSLWNQAGSQVQYLKS